MGHCHPLCSRLTFEYLMCNSETSDRHTNEARGTRLVWKASFARDTYAKPVTRYATRGREAITMPPTAPTVCPRRGERQPPTACMNLKLEKFACRRERLALHATPESHLLTVHD